MYVLVALISTDTVHFKPMLLVVLPIQTLMSLSAMEQTHVHQMETVSIQMVPLHVTVPLAMSWILVDRTARVSAFTRIPVVITLFMLM